MEYQTKNAYHGAKIEDAKSIWRDRAFRASTTAVADTRFGPGIYFWENSLQAAKNWVRIYYRTDDYGIIRATVICESLLDLLTTEHFQVLDSTRLKLAQHTGKPVTEIRHAAVLSFLAASQIIDGARLISGAGSNTRVHPESKLAGPFEVILCVYEPMNIVVTEYRDRSSHQLAS